MIFYILIKPIFLFLQKTKIMKKKTKERISAWGFIVGLLGLLLAIYGILEINGYALYGGSLVCGIGFSIGIFASPSMD